MGGFMTISRFRFNPGAFLAASLLALLLPWSQAAAQTAAPNSAVASTSAPQAPRIPARVTQTLDEGNRFTLRGNVHPLAKAAFDRGAVPDSDPATRMALVLRRSDDQEAALRLLLTQQQDKSSPNYHAWLTPEQFGKQFGPADTDIQAVTDWLTHRGFSAIKVSPGRTTIEFSGNVGQVRNAFQTEIHHFFANGKMHVANVSDPQIPSALSPVVAGVMSLHDFRPISQAHKLGTFRKTKSTGEVKPLFTFAACGSNGTQPCYAVGPGDFAKIYNVPANIGGLAPGTGQTIAIVQDSNVNIADITSYRSIFGLPANFTTSNIILNGPDPGIQGPDTPSGDEVEADLDVEVAGGVAPGATIDLVVSEDSLSIGMFGTDLSSMYIIDNNIAPVMSESFGSCEANITSAGETFYNQLWQQASAQGITVVISSGDNGSAACDPGPSPANQDAATQGVAVSGLASTVYDVALGGTDFLNGANPSPFWNPPGTATTSAKGYVPESTWNDSCAFNATSTTLTTCTAAIVNADNDPTSPNFGIDLVAGSGGPSMFNAKPVWQSGTTGNPADTFRDVPDISLFSGNGVQGSFYIICEQDANSGTSSSTSSCDLNSPFNDFQGVGGTSAAAPAFAGIMAMVNQKTGQRQGNANFVLYQLYKKNTAGSICPSNTAAVSATGCVFYDTINGNNSVACVGGTPNCSTATSGQFGVLIDPLHTSNPAFLTTPGYDLATGLGSVNVSNLLAAWSTATFTADTVAIISTSPATVNVTHGTSVSFNVKVTPTPSNGSTPEVVSLIAKPTTGSQLGIGAFTQDATTTLTSGSTTISTVLLPGGASYPVVASYAGDGTFAAGTSAPVLVTVTPEGSQTALNVVTQNSTGANVFNPGPISLVYGSSYFLQIAVSDSGGNQCANTVVACPTGTITLKDGAVALKDFSGANTASLNSQGIAEDQPVQLGVGTHSLVATYSGDNSFTPSTSNTNSVTVTTAGTTTSVSTSPSAVTVGAATNLVATVATQSSGVGPTGSVTFSINGTVVGSAVPVTSTAANNNAGTTAFATATLSHTFTAPGSQSVTAVFTTGDTTYSSSTSPAKAFTVTAGGTTVTSTVVTSSVSSVASGGMVTLTATVTGTGNNLPGPTGTVQFLSGATALGTPATCTATAGTATTPGTCKATLTTALSQLVPLGVPGTDTRRLSPLGLSPIHSPIYGPVYKSIGATAAILLIALLAGLKWAPITPATRRVAYAGVAALLLVALTAGFAGCGGGSSSSGGGGTTAHTDTITGAYSGDSTYAPSTSAAVSVSIQ
jgi:hypothetical protein